MSPKIKEASRIGHGREFVVSSHLPASLRQVLLSTPSHEQLIMSHFRDLSNTSMLCRHGQVSLTTCLHTRLRTQNNNSFYVVAVTITSGNPTAVDLHMRTMRNITVIIQISNNWNNDLSNLLFLISLLYFVALFSACYEQKNKSDAFPNWNWRVPFKTIMKRGTKLKIIIFDWESFVRINKIELCCVKSTFYEKKRYLIQRRAVESWDIEAVKRI